MKRVILAVLLILALLFGAYKWLQFEARTDLALNAKMATVICKVEDALCGITDGFNDIKKAGASVIRKTKIINLKARSWKEMLKFEPPEQYLRIYMKRGSVISCKLLERSGDQYTVEWNGSQSMINDRQIERVEHISRKAMDWPYKNDIVVKRTNGIVHDGKITNVTADKITISFEEGGGDLEMGVERSKIEYLLFAPVVNRESEEIEVQLRDQFPKMKVYEEGDITLLSDSYITSVKLYLKSLRQTQTDIYLNFFKLFQGRRPGTQNFIVMFDDIQDYWTYAAMDGIPGWIVIGYFSPLNKVLYTYNGFGERVEKWAFEVVQGVTNSFDQYVADFANNNIEDRYRIFLEGQAKEFTDSFWALYNIYKGDLQEGSLSVLRHEFTHELLHNWGLQNIVLIKPRIDSKKITRKKKEIMDAKDWKDKKALLEELMKFKKAEDEDLGGLEAEDVIDVESAQSWLSEGMAMYCATDPIGKVDEEWLFIYQEAVRKNETVPIEFFTNYKIGSFTGLCNKGVINAYGHSWAFTTFLMNKYPGQFIEYQIKVADERRQAGANNTQSDKLQLLLTTLNKSLPALEKEFREYMITYPKTDDPFVKQFMRYQEVWDRFYSSTVMGTALSTKHIRY